MVLERVQRTELGRSPCMLKARGNPDIGFEDLTCPRAGEDRVDASRAAFSSGV